MYKHFYWVRDRLKQNKNYVFWKPDVRNLEDYFTKQHLQAHHKDMRPIYLHCMNIMQDSARLC